MLILFPSFSLFFFHYFLFSSSSGYGLLEERLDSGKTLGKCLNDTVVPLVPTVAVECASSTIGPMVRKFQECMQEGDVGTGGSGGSDPLAQVQEDFVMQCLIGVLSGAVVPLDVESTSSSASVSLPVKMQPEAKRAAEDCVENTMAKCLLTGSTPQQCATKCAQNEIVSRATGSFDQNKFMECAEKKFSDGMFKKIEGRLEECTKPERMGTKEEIQTMPIDTVQCIAGTVGRMIQELCLDGGGDGSGDGGVESTLVASLLEGVRGMLMGGDGAGSQTLTGAVRLIQNMSPSVRSKMRKHLSIPFREAVSHHKTRCEAYLAGEASSFAFQQPEVIAQSITFFILSFVTFFLLIFIAIDGIYMATTKSVGMRYMLCNRLSRMAIARVKCFALCDVAQSSCRRCLYFCKIRTIKPTMDVEKEFEEETRGEGGGRGGKRGKRGQRVRTMTLEELEREEDSEDDSEDDIAEEERVEDAGVSRRQTSEAVTAEAVTAEPKKKNNSKKTKKSNNGKKCCRAMPPSFIATIIASTLCIFWMTIHLLSMSFAWWRFGMLLAHGILAIPTTVGTLNDNINDGNVTSAKDGKTSVFKSFTFTSIFFFLMYVLVCQEGTLTRNICRSLFFFLFSSI